jgi:hypothetical protein
MEPVQPLETPTPTLDTDVLAVVPADALAPEMAPPAPTEATVVVEHPFISLYDSADTTIAAIVLGACILVGIQVGVQRMFNSAKNSQTALTAFATSMCAILVAIYAADMLVAGPNVELLTEQERITTLSFIKDMTMLVFAYFFGTQSAKES